MTFGSPGWLFGLLLLPAVVAAYVWSRRRRQAAIGGPRRAGARRDRRGRSAAVAPARCRSRCSWPRSPSSSSPAPGRWRPSRRRGARRRSSSRSTSRTAWPRTTSSPRASARPRSPPSAFVREQPSGVRIGVVAFGPSAVIVQPPTLDHADVLQAINHLSLGGGTSLGAGILTSLDAIAGKTLKVNQTALGQDNSGRDQHRLLRRGDDRALLRRRGHEPGQPGDDGAVGVDRGRPHPDVGVGTAAGTTVQIDGFSVATALDSQTLQTLPRSPTAPTTKSTTRPA